MYNNTIAVNYCCPGRGVHANAAWLRLCREIMKYGWPSKPRGQETRELLGVQSTIDMRFPVITIANRVEGVRFYDFMFGEAAWILNGDNRVSSIKPFSKAIAKFSDDGRYFAGAYGPKIIDQLTYVVDCLLTDGDTRQAIIDIWRPNPRPSKDIPCTLSVQFFIREGKLHVMNTMRSSDVWLGVVYDWFNFSMLAHYVILLLRERGGPRLAPGELRLTAGSQHVYARNFDQISRCFANGKPAFDYAPLDPHEFDSPEDFISFLWSMGRLTKEAFVNGQVAGPSKRFLKEVFDYKCQ